MAATLLNIADLAARLESDPRTTRKFLRSITPADEQPGKGSRWSIEARRVQSLKSQFKKFQAEIQDTKSQDITLVEVDGTKVAEVKHLSLEKAPLDA